MGSERARIGSQQACQITSARPPEKARIRLLKDYNYRSFSRSESAGGSAAFKEELRAGDEAPDFELTSLDGGTVRLSSFRGLRHVLLEFGSIT